MKNSNVFDQVKNWKKPLHITRETIAKSYLKLLPNVQIVGITGSVGKTLTQNAIYKVLSQKYNSVVGDENLDPTFRIPKTILKAKPWDKYLIIEYGVEHPGEMDYYLKIAKPKIALITRIAPTHTRYFKNTQGVLAEKIKIIKSLLSSDYAILNADDPHLEKLNYLTKATVIWFGEKAPKGVKISHFKENIHGSSFRMHYNGQQASVSWKIIGKHQLLSAYAAATVGILTGMTLKQVAKGMSQVKSPLHRLNPIAAKKLSIIDDTYNSSPLALQESIKTLTEIGKGKQKIAVLGVMKDLGQLSKEYHKSIGRIIAKTNFKLLVTVGEEAKLIAQEAKKHGFKGKIKTVNSTKEAIYEVKNAKFKQPIILVKGSRHAHLERVVYGLLHKSTHISCSNCGQLK